MAELPRKLHADSMQCGPIHEESMQVVNRIGWMIHQGLDALMYQTEQVGTPLSFRLGLCLWRPFFVASGSCDGVEFQRKCSPHSGRRL